MNFDEFKKTLLATVPHLQLSAPLKALWFDKKGDWEAAHHIAQNIQSEVGSWIHAYLHRKEGDLVNANYWYRLAKKPVGKNSFAVEWEQIVKDLLA